MINNIFNHPVKEGRFMKSLSNQQNLLQFQHDRLLECNNVYLLATY